MESTIKDRFLEIYTGNIKREGSDQLLENLQKQDFFTAPASSKFHGNHEGGLVEHSVKVYENLLKLTEKFNVTEDKETLAIVSLLHDLCKMNIYKIDYRNVKNENGQWVKQPYYTIKDSFPYGHGEKSVFIINQYMKLNIEEVMAIRWHMGGFDTSVKGGDRSQSLAYEKYPLAALLHCADLIATFYDKI